jgi:hypothetical protein
VRQPLVVDGHAPGPTRPAPRLGADTVDALLRAGLTTDEIEQLAAPAVAR